MASAATRHIRHCEFVLAESVGFNSAKSCARLAPTVENLVRHRVAHDDGPETGSQRVHLASEKSLAADWQRSHY